MVYKGSGPLGLALRMLSPRWAGKEERLRVLFSSFLDDALNVTERVSMCEWGAGAGCTHSLWRCPQKPRTLQGEVAERPPRGLLAEDPLQRPAFPDPIPPAP